MQIKQAKKLKGALFVPGDKSITHRAVMLGSIADGTTIIRNAALGEDCLSTIRCFRQMGIHIEIVPGTTVIPKNRHLLETTQITEGVHMMDILVHGRGLKGLTAPVGVLDAGNSGTTIRLASGILAGQSFESILSGDDSLKKRPMGRIITPLRQMGADIESLEQIAHMSAPLRIRPANLCGIDYTSPVASAQVKSAILLAGLYADGPTSVTEPALSRNHTELMLSVFGASVNSTRLNNSVVSVFNTKDKVSDASETDTKKGRFGAVARITPCDKLYAADIKVPGDISSAAYFIAAGLCVPDSEILLKNVGINPTRTGILTVCEKMGANITCLNQKIFGNEPMADFLIQSSNLKGTTIEGEIIPTLIDEIPIICVMACLADGTTIIKDAAELKVKESNRIDAICTNLQAMGADITPTEDGMIIRGGYPLTGAIVDSKDDHRIAMSLAVAGLTAQGETTIRNSTCVDISYPGFFSELSNLSAM